MSGKHLKVFTTYNWNLHSLDPISYKSHSGGGNSEIYDWRTVSAI